MQIRSLPNESMPETDHNNTSDFHTIFLFLSHINGITDDFRILATKLNTMETTFIKQFSGLCADVPHLSNTESYTTQEVYTLQKYTG